MFQDMNVVKFAPFTLLAIYQNSMYPPQSIPKPPLLANYPNKGLDAQTSHNYSPQQAHPSDTNANGYRTTKEQGDR